MVAEGQSPVVPDPSPALRTWALRVWTLVGVLVAVLLLARLLAPLRPLLLLVLVATLLVVLIAPAVDGLQRRGVPRAVTTALSFAGIGVLLTFAVRAVVPVVADQVEALVLSLPTLADQLDALAERLGLEVALDPEAVTQALREPQTRQAVLDTVNGLTGAAGSLLAGSVLLLAAPVIAFYVLVDLPRLWVALLRAVPVAQRGRVDAFLRDAGHSLSGFVRGQLVVATFVGVSTGLLVSALGIPYALLIGAAAGLTNLVPFVGPFVGGLLALGVALATGPPRQAVFAVIGIIIIQQVESQLVSPLVLGKAVELRALAVLVSVLVGGVLFGLLGLLLAVPVVTVARAAVRHLVLGEQDVSPAPPAPAPG